MDNIIATLSDPNALGILAKVAEYELNSVSDTVDLDADQLSALRAKFGAPEGVAVADGDLARAALQVLAQDPEMATRIRTMATSQAPDAFSFEALADAALYTALVKVLMTGVSIERDKDGKWAVQVKTHALDSEALSALARKFMDWYAGKPSD